jgi:hypothetical protein
MILAPTDRLVLRCGFAQIAQLAGTYDSKTDQTDQTAQRLDLAGEFGALIDLELTCRHPKLTSGSTERSDSGPLCARSHSSCASQVKAERLPA